LQPPHLPLQPPHFALQPPHFALQPPHFVVLALQAPQRPLQPAEAQPVTKAAVTMAAASVRVRRDEFLDMSISLSRSTVAEAPGYCLARFFQLASAALM
jgi:hypothetical protein